MSVHVGVDFGGSDTFMPQHTLDGTQIGATFQQVSGERMAECMGTDVFFQADGIGQFLDEMEDHDSGNVLASFADEHIVFVSGFDGCLIALDEV